MKPLQSEILQANHWRRLVIESEEERDFGCLVKLERVFPVAALEDQYDPVGTRDLR